MFVIDNLITNNNNKILIVTSSYFDVLSLEQLWIKFCVAVDLTNGQLTPNNNTPLLTQALSGTLWIHNMLLFVVNESYM